MKSSYIAKTMPVRVRGKDGAVIGQARPGSTRQKSGHINFHQDTACGLVNLISDSDYV